jgi:Zn-dependent protease
MAAATVVGVAASIILHELGHTLVARAYGLPVKSITLFVFGGVAEMEGEPKAPIGELLMALAGPLVSVGLGFAFAVLANLLPESAPTEFHAVGHYLSMLNFTLAVFNMLPAFPLDGGRVLRAIVWLFSRDPLKATRIAARSGEVIAILLMAAGVISALGGGVGHGLWWVILGWFILSMASAHRREAEAKQLLSGARVRDLMTPDPVTAPADMSVEDFVETVLARHPHDLIPIISGEAVIGGAGFREAKAAARESWASTPLSIIATPITQIPSADQSLEIEAALERMQRAGASRLIVTDGDRLAGILTLKDLASHLRFRSEFAAAAKRQPA